MEKFKIQIFETLKKVVEVEAENPDEAFKKVKTAYANEEITMPEDLKKTVFAIVK